MKEMYIVQVLHSDGTISYLSRVAIFVPPPKEHASGVVLDYSSDVTKAVKFSTDIYANFVATVLNVATGEITKHSSTHCVMPLSMLVSSVEDDLEIALPFPEVKQ